MLTAAGVTWSASAASAKLRWAATASNTRSAFRGSLSKLRAASAFLVRRSDIAFAAQARKAKTAPHGLPEEPFDEHHQSLCDSCRAAANRCGVSGYRL